VMNILDTRDSWETMFANQEPLGTGLASDRPNLSLIRLLSPATVTPDLRQLWLPLLFASDVSERIRVPKFRVSSRRSLCRHESLTILFLDY